MIDIPEAGGRPLLDPAPTPADADTDLAWVPGGARSEQAGNRGTLRPMTALAKGALRLVPFLVPGLLLGQVPDGFDSIFNGRNLAGWHTSLTSHHGDTSEWRVVESAIIGQQDREGNGGILLTDETFEDFEISLEIKPDLGCDGGLFLRSNASGQAYQVMLDYLPGGNVGGVFGEGLTGLETMESQGWEKAWKKDAWNTLRASIRGVAPRIDVWLNGQQIVEFQDTENRLPGGATNGSIALQVHGGERCKPGLEHRFRNLAVKRL